jgi:catechol 2,3-dioxygenase-like lactoylglutathione lyase family enzyme
MAARPDAAPQPSGLPGLRGIEHVGLTVPDLDAAVEFFVRVLGCEFVFDGGEFGGDPDFMVNRLNVHKDARVRYCFLRCATGPNLELFEYDAPGQAQTPPRNSDVGGHHLAFHVDDIDAAVAHLKRHGVAVLGEKPVRIEAGLAAGSRWVYFLAPWGLQLELCGYPDGKGAPDSPARRLWHPAYPER